MSALSTPSADELVAAGYPTREQVLGAAMADTGSIVFAAAYTDETMDHVEAEWAAQQEAEIAAEQGFELFLETRYSEQIQAEEDAERRTGGF